MELIRRYIGMRPTSEMPIISATDAPTPTLTLPGSHARATAGIRTSTTTIPATPSEFSAIESAHAWSAMKATALTAHTQMAVESCSRLREKATDHIRPTRPKPMVTTSIRVLVRRSMSGP